MADEPDKSERTEEPTPKRLEDARKEGQVPASRDVTSFLVLASGMALFSPVGSSVFVDLLPLLASLLDHPHLLDTDPSSLASLSLSLVLGVSAVLALPFLGFAIAAVVASFIQHGFVCSLKRVQPSLKKVSPLGGIKRMFGPRALADFFKNVAKIVLVGAAGWYALGNAPSELSGLVTTTPIGALDVAQSWFVRATGAALVIVLIVALIDYAIQRHTHWEQMKMTRQQVRDEHKQSDGDPHVRAKIRQIRSERARHRMMQAVPEATVVITNPTHFAVALRYESGSMTAPEVVAKGADQVAFRIRALAREHNVPVIENKPLARALYADVDIGKPIPRQHFEAVADVIGFVMRQREQARA